MNNFRISLLEIGLFVFLLPHICAFHLLKEYYFKHYSLKILIQIRCDFTPSKNLVSCLPHLIKITRENGDLIKNRSYSENEASSELIIICTLSKYFSLSKKLSLRTNFLKKLPDCTFQNTRYIEELDISDNQLEVLQPKLLRGLEKLRVLRLAGNQLKEIDE